MVSDRHDLRRFEKRISWGYYLSFVCQGLTGSIFGPSMIWFASRTGSTVAEITPVLLCFNIGFIIASLSIANLFDREPGNRLMAGAIAGLAAILLGYCGVRARWQFFTLAFVMGTMLAVIDNGGNILFPWLLGERSKRPMNLVHLFYSVGCIITPFLIGLALRYLDQITPVFLLLAVLVVYPAVLLFRLPSPLPLRDSSPDSSADQSRIPAAVLLFGLFLFLFSSCQSTVNTWTSTVLIRSGLADESAAAMMTSIFWVGTFTGRLLAAWAVERQRPERIVLTCLLIGMLNGTVMFFARSSLFLTGICVFFSGFATGPILANMLSIMKGRGLVSAKVNGIVLACSQFGGMLLPSIFGRIWGDSAGSYTPFVLITLCATLAELIMLRFILSGMRNEK